MSNYFLTQKAAEQRAECFSSSPDYFLYLRLNKGENYHGFVQVRFALKSRDHCFIDFNGREVVSVLINNHAWEKKDIDAKYKEGFMHFDKDELVVGENLLEIKFRCVYSHDGNGLHTFTDTDGAQYGYCQTEPYCCNRIFPVFDQPDIKGTINFLISAPNDWTVVTNTPAERSAPLPAYQDEHPFFKRVKSTFPEDFSSPDYLISQYRKSPHLSSYLFAFSFGPFKEIKSEDSTTVPMSIFCRASLYTHALEQQHTIFAFPKHGIRFYEEFFRFKYPFEKYDMVFCPEYTVGAMEYPGMITFNDRFIVRETPTVVQISALGKVNLHELAHMWFGDLVTMRWWNDLWLNESFADFACYLCGHFIRDKLGFPSTDAMTSFCIRKNWGYNEDQMITTHPIACEVANTSKAESIFDGITYSKGAATLKQLYFLLGHEAFSVNLGNYFSKYQWRNSTLKDFLNELAHASKPNDPVYDLEKWNASWIETAGLNVVEAKWKLEDRTVVLHQSAALPAHPTLRYHKMKVAFFDDNCVPYNVQDVVLNNSAETAIQAPDTKFKAVLPNYEDWDFIKITLDKRSSVFFMRNLHKLDSTNRMMVIRSFYEMVRDAKLKATDFIDSMSDSFLGHRSDLLSLQTVLGYLEIAESFIHPDFKKRTKQKLFNIIFKLLQHETDPDRIKVFKSSLIHFASADEHVEILKLLLEEHCKDLKLSFTPKEKWSILIKMVKSKKYSKTQKKILKEYLLSTDKSDNSRSSLIVLEALGADASEAESFWREFTLSNRKMSFQDIDYALQGFFCSSKGKEHIEKYTQRFFEDFPNVANKEAKEFGKSLMGAIGYFEDPDKSIEGLTQMKSKLDASKEFHIIAVEKELENLKRKQKAYHLYTDPRVEFVFSSEQVSEGHPDKMCDIISDAILDAILEKDPEGKVAVETMIKNNQVIVAGELSTKAQIDVEQVIRKRVEEIGYRDENVDFNPATCTILNLLDTQSPEIAMSVHVDKADEEIGAGDQGLMLGYATNESPELMPLTFVYATNLLLELKKARISGKIPWLRPDAKSQVAIRYARSEKGSLTPLTVTSVLISTQHTPEITHDKLLETVKKEIIEKVIDPKLLTEETSIIINPSQSFVIGGPKGDAGVTGRKVIADTYGGWGGHGGGAFSGKDPTKVDRSAAYGARWIAKSLVAAGYCERCLVQVSYAIGLAEPLNLFVDTFGTVKEGLTDSDLVHLVDKNFDMRPGMLIKELDLKKPIYSQNCTYGHFMKKNLSWENPKKFTK